MHFPPSPQPEGQGFVTSQEGAQAVTPAVPSVFGFGACPSGGTAVDSSSGWRERTGAVDPAAPPPHRGQLALCPAPQGPACLLPGWGGKQAGLASCWRSLCPLQWHRGGQEGPEARCRAQHSNCSAQGPQPASPASQPLPQAGRCCPQQSPLILSQGGTRVTWSLAAARPATPSAGRGRGCKPGTGNGAFLVPATAGSEKGPWELQGR